MTELMIKELTCFLIDDDEDDREIFEIALASIGLCQIYVTADNGKEAFDKLFDDEFFFPDFIFLDLNMPIMNGKQFLTQIKSIERLNSIPVVIYSTSSRLRDIEDARELGALHYIVKPSSIDLLEDILTNIFTNNVKEFLINPQN